MNYIGKQRRALLSELKSLWRNRHQICHFLHLFEMLQGGCFRKAYISTKEKLFRLDMKRICHFEKCFQHVYITQGGLTKGKTREKTSDLQTCKSISGINIYSGRFLATKTRVRTRSQI